MPYWTYDSDTSNFYTGQRGGNYVATETYTTTENSRTVTKARSVTKIRWTPVSCEFQRFFDDILILTSKSLPQKYANQFETWDLKNLTPFSEKYLSGFLTETYQVELKEGFEAAKQTIELLLREEVRRRIGGNHQRIHTIRLVLSDITFKHILLPVWINSFRYRNRAYRFLINGRSGEVQGERPYSA